jgi:HAD superfamily hydrolase (TIGR01509 family)
MDTEIDIIPIPNGKISPMPFLEAILWDMDGVLADTTPLHFATWKQVLAKYGLPFDKQEFQYIFGLKNHDLLPRLVGKPLDHNWIEQVAAQKERAFRQALTGRLQPLPGVIKWLDRFNGWNCKQAVASSAPPENVETLVDELNIRKYFTALVTPGNLPGKPDPAVFLLAARQLGAVPHNCLVIEDSIPGVEAAYRAKMKCIAVTTTNPPEVLTRADIVVRTLDQLTVRQVESLFHERQGRA